MVYPRTRRGGRLAKGKIMTTLVTGSSGFVGRAIMARLPDAIGRDPIASASTGIIDDLSDRARLRDLVARETITHVIHAGGVSGPMVLADDPAGVIAINVTGSINLLYAAMGEGVTT